MGRISKYCGRNLVSKFSISESFNVIGILHPCFFFLLKMIPFGQRYCEVCEVYITRKNFCQHSKTRRHLNKLETRTNPLVSIEEPPRKQLKTNETLSADNTDKLVQKADEYCSLSAEDIVHFMQQFSRPPNDSTPPCNCCKCAEAIRCLGLTKHLHVSTEQPAESEKLVDERCIDFNRTYQSLVLFPPSNHVDEDKLQMWKSMTEFAKMINFSGNEENKENIPPPSFKSKSTLSKDSHNPSIEFARRHNTHLCTDFGRELPEYIQFSHCHEEMFHFFGVKDRRTNCNILFVIMK